MNAGPLVVGVSGGLDSMSLLYLLRFKLHVAPDRLQVAHLDHRMRVGSSRDASWLAGVCLAWGVPFHLRTAEVPVRTEAEGREARYQYFAELKSQLGAQAVLTGHTADDQAETVLFRIARGSGPAGLAGIRDRLHSGVVRPLLPFWRVELEALALACRIPVRADVTNLDPRWTRNRIRREVLPALEAAVPGARKALATLGRVSASEHEALVEMIDALLEGKVRWPSGGLGGAELEVKTLEGLSEPLLAVVVRRICSRAGAKLGHQATQDLGDFVRRGASGRRIGLTGGISVERSLGIIRIGPTRLDSQEPGERAVVLEGPEGWGSVDMGGRRVEVRWGAAPLVDYTFVASFPQEGTGRDYTLRPWRPGDRIRLDYGQKKVKKLLAEKRVPKWARAQVPVLADAEGAVLWVPGISAPGPPEASRERIHVGVRYPPGGQGS